MGIVTVLWEKWAEFRRDFYKITLSAMIAPLGAFALRASVVETITSSNPPAQAIVTTNHRARQPTSSQVSETAIVVVTETGHGASVVKVDPLVNAVALTIAAATPPHGSTMASGMAPANTSENSMAVTTGTSYTVTLSGAETARRATAKAPTPNHSTTFARPGSTRHRDVRSVAGLCWVARVTRAPIFVPG